MKALLITFILTLAFLLSNCAVSGSGSPSMTGPSYDVRAADIKAEPEGNHYIGRRYYVEKTRFWGYVRKPGQPWSDAKLVLMNEDKKKAPDRYSEMGSGDSKYGFDANYEYKLYGRFTGDRGYDPNSDQILPEFQLTGYSVINKNPGWLFRTTDKYDPKRITLFP